MAEPGERAGAQQGTRPARRVAGVRRNAPAVEYDAPRWLRSLAGASWRAIVVVIAVGMVFYATAQVKLLFIAVFLALVFTAVLRPLVELLARFLPRFVATGVAILTGVLFFVGLLTYVGYSVANEWEDLSDRFSDGLGQIVEFLESGQLPFRITSEQIAGWINDGQKWLQDHAGDLAGQAAQSAGSVVEVLTSLALAIFCTVFFLARGREMWTWFLNQLPERFREGWIQAGGAGWYTFSGYTRGTVIIAVTDGMLAFVLLLILGVPLAAPLAVLVFIGAFIPLVGAPAAMVIAMIVALAANGLWSAVFVGVGIALIGQFEGHVLQPLVMGKQVSIHPVVVALAVAGGTLTAGILGAVVSVPLVAVAWAIFSRLRTLDPPMTVDEADDGMGPQGARVRDEDAPV
ncbi:MAG: AI-2E family transporter [Cellulomonas sp.]|uniref:AI-2E family transporter n=1 Tax=Cellulomonas gelida TaxID=1712 RepID=A0A4Y3KGF6_9CELL|nr:MULTISPECIES: AI-2E family transporter [Cellulomonas]KMM44797.1 permease [Cellulomonas sp. A375-1]MCR6647301.1 AI-2E family transporter [Cellulomonas sp.]GEA82953.1 AI-2E family transporter [Cellulomonas gelida]GGL35379.1 AI-2E family transporter [Cellulomonas gelida]